MDGPCRSGNFFLSALRKTNLYLLVIEDWSEYRQSYFYNFNCHISNRVYDAGAFRIVNGTCAHIETQTSLKKKEKCPALKNVRMKCSYNVANSFRLPRLWELFLVTLTLILRNCSWIVTLIYFYGNHRKIISVIPFLIFSVNVQYFVMSSSLRLPTTFQLTIVGSFHVLITLSEMDAVGRNGS